MINNIYSEQQDLLNERFDEETLSNKYSNEFNNWRQRLLDLISTNLRLEINQVNEFVFCRKNKNQISKYELEKPRNLHFNKSIIRSEEVCINRLVMNQFRFVSQFSSSQLIAYKHILRISVDELISILAKFKDSQDKKDKVSLAFDLCLLVPK